MWCTDFHFTCVREDRFSGERGSRVSGERGGRFSGERGDRFDGGEQAEWREPPKQLVIRQNSSRPCLADGQDTPPLPSPGRDTQGRH